ncbi:MAG: phosphatidylglycerophosphatase A [Zhaonellaceae bacterium]|jgi:phosphatidylglycerophosphatase A|nr:phosphatidylglycerophosphatase A [Clostridia bacterium]
MDLMEEQLALRGVQLEDIASIVFDLQSQYYPDLNLATCLEAVRKVLKKRDVQYTILTGIALDTLAEQCLLPEPLQTIIYTDESLYGLDEVLAYGITNIYGSIGITSFGYLDKIKPGIIKDLDNNTINKVNTFLDDMVAGIAAAACAKIAHAQTENLVSGNHHENQD